MKNKEHNICTNFIGINHLSSIVYIRLYIFCCLSNYRRDGHLIDTVMSFQQGALVDMKGNAQGERQKKKEGIERQTVEKKRQLICFVCYELKVYNALIFIDRFDGNRCDVYLK